MGPYFLESWYKDWWGILPSWCKLPMMGSLGGDGGSLGHSFGCFFFVLRRNRENIGRSSKRINRIGSHGGVGREIVAINLWFGFSSICIE